MSENDLGLTEIERDAITELANIGVSRAAASLRKMVGRQVLLSVPSVEIVSRKAAAALIDERAGLRSSVSSAAVRTTNDKKRTLPRAAPA